MTEGNVHDIDCDSDVSAAWLRGKSSVSIVNHTVKKELHGQTINQTKSMLNFAIKMKRNPKTAIIYVILPTLLITIFNIFSACLPTGQGIFMHSGFAHFTNVVNRLFNSISYEYHQIPAEQGMENRKTLA